MIAQIACQFVFDIPDVVVNCIVPGEKFISQRHIGLSVFQNIDEREFIGSRTAEIVKFRECCQKLVG